MRPYWSLVLVLCALQQRTAADQPNHALSFDGVDDVVVLDGEQVLLTGPHTVECWVKPRRLVYSRWVWIAGQCGSTPGDDCYQGTGLAIDRDAAQASFILDPIGCENRFVTLAPVQQDSWYHLAGTFDGTLMRFFVNGALVASRSGSFTYAAKMSFGAVWSGFSSTFVGFFEGDIDEVRIWRKARTQAELTSTMNRKLTGQECGLAGVWSFDEGFGQAVNPGLVGVVGTLGQTAGVDSSDPTWIASDIVLAPARCVGDLNDDGLVDDGDFVLFVQDYQRLECDEIEMPPNCPSDLNRSCVVDDGDFVVFAVAYNALLCGAE